MVSANHCLRSIETCLFLGLFTQVIASHASSNSGLIGSFNLGYQLVYRIALYIETD